MCAFRWTEFGRTAKIFFNANAGQVGAVNQKETNKGKYRAYASGLSVANEIKLSACRQRAAGNGSWTKIIAETQMLEDAQIIVVRITASLTV